jgi:NADPH:quinone reductase-like Zn-dependent oxidoreductase
VDKPAVEEDGVLVRVMASSANPLDWHFMRGKPYFLSLLIGLRKPRRTIAGVDVAGRVEEVGAGVTRLRPGDEVFGGHDGAFAEYVCGRERNFVPKPVNATFEQAGAVAVAGCTALQAVRDHGRVGPAQTVLINGAAGGVGTFAVQIAKAYGAEVTAVCSTRNLELVRSIGADHVIDYTSEDFTRSGTRYDAVIDTVGNRSLSAIGRALTSKGTLVLVGGGGNSLVGPMAQSLWARVRSRFTGQRMVMFVAKITNEDLLVLKELIEAGKVTPVIDKTYPLSETREAVAYLEAGHARGKVAISVG